MTYFVLDIHGEYDLFLKLLDKIGFSDGDILYVLGDMIDKGKQSVKLVDYIRRKPNIKAIVGNHEFDFLKYYYRLMKSLQDGDDANAVLSKLQAYFPNGEDRLSWEAMDYLESLPFYIETADFICVHAGVETDEIRKLKLRRTAVILKKKVFGCRGIIKRYSSGIRLVLAKTMTGHL